MRAQGFTTKLDLSVGGRSTIDIYATIRHAGSQFCLALGCLYKIGVVEATIYVILYLSGMAKSLSTPVHKGALVSNASFSVDAREIGSRSDIDLIDFQTLSTSMVDFQGYFRQIIEDYEELPFHNYLVESPCAVGKELSGDSPQFFI